ncbi:MAG: anaerobic ribonucleoside-triphosphate reductase activating protein [Gammaproteobacteria bacterium]|nr:anaerobic ribonucleoside-triphosphate reductase activating protein [Gammaproteobacteria bacterium]
MTDPNEMRVGGFTPLTSIDYPGVLSAVIFCQGCPWRCRYCHNSELIPRHGDNHIPWERVLKFLHQRRGLLDAVVFSGGEPTLQKQLPSAIQTVKSMGFKIGLHTGGAYPERLMRLLASVDWVGLDIKASKENYAKVTGVEGSGEKAWQSAKLLIDSGVSHALRTTIHPQLISTTELQKITQRLNDLGPARHQLQTCVTDHCLDPALRN